MAGWENHILVVISNNKLRNLSFNAYFTCATFKTSSSLATMSSSNDQYRQEQYQWFQQQAREQPQPWDRAAYPPNNSSMNPSPNSTNTAVTNATYYNKAHENMNELRGQTPSPTPSELKELNTPLLDWKTLTNWRFWIRREWLCVYSIHTLLLTLTNKRVLCHPGRYSHYNRPNFHIPYTNRGLAYSLHKMVVQVSSPCSNSLP